MQHQTLKVMAVDDDHINLEILMKNLKDSGYESIGFDDGDTAWSYLNKHPEDVDIILLDKMMPRMDGMQVLEQLKSHSLLKNIPVIIQTGDISTGVSEDERLKESLVAGAYYYLEKPFDPSVMVSMVNAAARDCVRRSSLLSSIKRDATINSMMREGRFEYKTIPNANKLAAAIAKHALKPEEVGVALAELMVNAVEHGNLNIGFELKGQLISDGGFEEEVARRLALPEYGHRNVQVQFMRRDYDATVIIEDQGTGFNWSQYEEFDPIRLTEPNGRGIAAAKLMGVDIEYVGNGSKVICLFKTMPLTNS